MLLAVLLGMTSSAAAQTIQVTPTSVNAYSQGATTVFLTFTNVINKRPTDACWCGELVEAAPDIGMKCKPGAEFGCLPVRYNQSRLSSNGAYTDIMSIPSSVARRAYLDAARGAEATFYYVRRFVSTAGGPDEFVPVTIRLGGNGASAPFSITNVKLSWGVDKPVLLIKADEKLPRITAEITYTGTGRLTGRWEIVKPGEELPSSRDLLSESALPPEERGKQRRYTQLSRFNVFLPPSGRFVLAGPEGWRVPNHLEGMYLVLLRLEAADDANGNLASSVGAIETGGVAGFSMPTLRYYVGAGTGAASVIKPNSLTLTAPPDGATLSNAQPLQFVWQGVEEAGFYRIEIESSEGKLLWSAVALAGSQSYRAPSWLVERLAGEPVRWRVVALTRSGEVLQATLPRSLTIQQARK